MSRVVTCDKLFMPGFMEILQLLCNTEKGSDVWSW